MTANFGSAAPKTEIEDRNRPGGWMVRASVLGGLVAVAGVVGLALWR